MAHDQARERAFDALHDDLVRQRGDLELTLKRSLYLGLLKLYDRLGEGVELAEAAGEPTRRLVEARDEILELLDVEGVTPIDAEGEFDRHWHSAVARVDTSSESLHGKVALVHRRGFVKGGKVLRPTDVTVYRFTPQEVS